MNYLRFKLPLILVFSSCLLLEGGVFYVLFALPFSSDFLYALMLPFLFFAGYLLSQFLREKSRQPASWQAARFKTEREQLEQKFRQEDWEANQKNQQFVDFITGWVHDIKTPLTVLDLTATSEQKAAILEMKNKIDLVLFYSKTINLYDDLHPEKLFMRELVEKLLKQYASLFIHKNLTVTLDFQQETPLDADRIWLSFVIAQLITNALKYTPRSETISFTVQEDEHAHWLTISNGGVPIEDEELPRIFERGYTGKVREFGNSTGMGLFLSQAIMTKLGGKISATNQPQTSFTLLFPKSA